MLKFNCNHRRIAIFFSTNEVLCDCFHSNSLSDMAFVLLTLKAKWLNESASIRSASSESKGHMR